MTDLQKAIKRVLDAIAVSNALDAWDSFRQVCELLRQIIPGFVCPFEYEEGTPTLEQMTPYAQQWDAQYCQSEPPPDAA